MNFQGIEKTSLLNGDGLRCVLWVSGCSHHCKGCQNPDTWNPDSGERFWFKDYWTIQERVSQDYCDGLTLSGGDPMFPDSRPEILALCKFFRKDFGNTKTIWMYTGYKMSEIQNDPILEYIDVVVDGEYIEEQRNINRQWCGSENQRVWRKKDGLWFADEPMYDTDNYTARSCGSGVDV